MIKVGIVGATGYGGRELIRLLDGHPEAEIAALASTSAAGEHVADVLPAMRKRLDLTFEAFDPDALARKCDAVFLGVPSTKSMELGKALRAVGARVLDIGADFRLKSPEAFAKYYKTTHTAQELLPESVYGLVPHYREALKKANLVAVPGCYPISILLPLRAILDQVKAAVPIVIDSVSGISGAGRTLSDGFHFPEMNENMKAYKLAVHQHIPEIEQELAFRAMVQFTPHVAPITRGILTTITFRPDGPVDPAKALARYGSEPFVRVLPPGQLPEVKHVRASNFCDIGWVMDERTGNLVVVSAIDNLMGGTAGMAIQCMNLMFGIEETTGLHFGGMAV
ncbi:MAG: N-acetyl-gamma-glutamyl-phosphate reductase [Candidatus Hydrogenedentota bacterium]